MHEKDSLANSSLERIKAALVKVLSETKTDSAIHRIFIEAVGEIAPLILTRLDATSPDEDVKPGDVVLGLLDAMATCSALVIHCVGATNGLRDDLIELFTLSFMTRVKGAPKDVTEPSDSSIDSDASLSEERNPSA